MEAPTLLVVDDETELLSVLDAYFGGHGFRVLTACSVAQARLLLASDAVQVAVLDVHLPHEDGLSLARWLRVQQPQVGILMLSSAAEPIDRIVGLEIGADDYVAKPFEPRELLARVKALLRRAQAPPCSAPASAPPEAPAVAPAAPSRIVFGTCVLDIEQRRLIDAQGANVDLTASEFDLLLLFARHPHRPLSRDQIMEGAHHRSWDVFDRSIDLRVMRLRRKVEHNPEKPEVLKTVRGVGYMFVPGVPG